MTRQAKGKALKIAALVVDVGAPLAATLSQFPIWVERSSDSTVSGLFVVFALLSCIPFLRQIKAFIRSPSAPVLWAVIFVVLLALQSIISEMLIVSFCGMISNLIGAGIYKFGTTLEDKEK